MNFDPIAYINEPRWRHTSLGLKRMLELLERLGNPHEYVACVHVAGTNGKGSTSYLIASALTQAGYCCGLFSSPYVYDFKERIRVDGNCIDDASLYRLTLQLKSCAEAMEDHPTEFELMTALAFMYFKEKGCQLAVIEVGLGGRLDSTNVIPKPLVSVITRLGLDHTAVLGSSLEEIAQEKAGIIKAGCSCVSYPQQPSALKVIQEVASSKQAALMVSDFDKLQLEPPFFGEAPTADQSDPASLGQGLSYKGHEHIKLGLLGPHQARNAAVALDALDLLAGKGFTVDEKAIKRAFAQAHWPGRFEIMSKQPLIVFDGAHNPQGARALQASVKQMFPDRRITLIMSALEDKDYTEMLEVFLELGDTFIATQSDNPRALGASKLARSLRWVAQDIIGCAACTRCQVEANPKDALAFALRVVPADGVIVAAGSLYTLGALKQAYMEICAQEL